ncbi:Metallo-dependent hydrolase [Punctularia strigosozonata HHB-11173 SS5]|uniref:Metallo-dependent hydrolase n=1 Tax=Punctularia strigosozonata (strain HHB-11173) TaxID=741275 RepID=UPI000441701C|nr:Metallo-dependent hydrolase [Punctularia strigosozonata HHB-11173 SS5]EIN07156.1 Metallo-dependent hydrolase [Punctularia strigosozonata HHB-11173 SS5]
MSRATVYYGAVINPTSLTEYRSSPQSLIAVSAQGDIDWVVYDVQDSMVQQVMAERGYTEADVVVLKRGEFIMPGFVDTHTHAPQVPNMGSGQQYELLDWLNEVTFPVESKFSDVTFARRTYQSVVRRKIDSGTTTCCYYGSLHLEATKVLADVVHELGQRAFVGKCNMNNNSPDYYIEPSVEVSVQATEALIQYVRSLPPTPWNSPDSSAEPLVHPIITPRFAISCTSDLMTQLGALASRDPSLRIQTHISENANEIAFTKELFPDCETYAEVYDKHGLLKETTVLAHAVHLEPAEVELIKKRNAGVSHCPTSNFNIRSGMAKVGHLLDNGIKVGLGTDVSGGFSPSILTAVQHASICSKMVALQTPSDMAEGAGHGHTPRFANRQLSVPTLLYLATKGGADVCNLSHRIGSFESGKSFDALFVSMRSETGNPAVWGVDVDWELGLGVGAEVGGGETAHALLSKELDGMLERFFFCGDDRNIRRIYVQGRMIGGSLFQP